MNEVTSHSDSEQKISVDAPTSKVVGILNEDPGNIPSPLPKALVTRDELLNDFYSNLEARYYGVRPSEEYARVICDRIAEKFSGDRTWRRAREIEQLLALVISDEQVATEIPRLLAEAERITLPHTKIFNELFAEEKQILQQGDIDDEQRTKALQSLRYLQQRLVNDLNYAWSQLRRKREYAKQYSARVSALFLTVFIYFFLLLYIQFFATQPDQVNPAVSSDTAGELNTMQGESIEGGD